MFRLLVATVAVVILFSSPVSANNIQNFCGDRYCSVAPDSYAPHKKKRVSVRDGDYYVSATSYSTATQVVPNPPGCPARAFCGCGAALEVFGRHVRSLWLARNWFQFPRTSPAPGMVAVRKHHVFVIRQVLENNTVLAYDANSGGRKTRIHVRSLSGFVVVNPHART